MAQSVHASIGMGPDLFRIWLICSSRIQGSHRLCRILRDREDIVALRVFQKQFEYFLYFVINHQLALSCPPFHTMLDYSLSADFPICALLG
jgi:hypothetical protein